MVESEQETFARPAAECCPVPMWGQKPCGRPSAGGTINGINYCVMHTPMGKDDTVFQREVERILKEAGHGLADFTRFVFPSANYRNRCFEAECVFKGSAFSAETDFIKATFAEKADFSGASFQQSTDFSGASFVKGGNFVAAKFHQIASFSGVNSAIGVDFTWARFAGPALFNKSRFEQGAVFHEATFTLKANFDEAKFACDASFYGATFNQDVTFNAGELLGLVDFRRTKFLGVAEFLETGFRRDDEQVPGPVFSLSDFSRPESVIFYKTYLGQALFHNCNVSKLAFISVEWRRRKRNGKRVVFEEEIKLSDTTASALKPKNSNPNERDYELIEGLYQQLKKNYDEAKDYWTAGDFHFGEMEMKRLSSGRKNSFVRYVHQHLRLAALYRYASNYGESFGWPALWVLVILLVSGASFPFVGLRYDIGKQQLMTSVVHSPLTLPSRVVPISADSHTAENMDIRNEEQSSTTPGTSNPEPVSEPPIVEAELNIPPESQTRKRLDLTHKAGSTTQSPIAGPSTPTTSSPRAQEITSGQPSSVVLLNYWAPFLPGQEHDNLWLARWRLFGNSFVTALDIAAFQREPVYQPSYPWGRLLTLLEMVFTSSLFGLFLLAARRQFRR